METRPDELAPSLFPRSCRLVDGRVLSHAQERPEVVAMAKSLHALRLILRAIAERLEAAGHVNSNGRRFAAVSVRIMLG